MTTKTAFLVALLVKTITSQRLPPYYNQLYSETVIDRYSPQIPQYPKYPQYPYPTTLAENDVICKNLASAIQNVIFDKFSQNCFRTPVFGPIAAPLVNEIKNSLCTCPVCSSLNVSPNSISKSYVSPTAVSNVIKSSAPNVLPGCRKTNVSVNRNYDLLGFLKSFSTCDCGCRGPVVV